MEERKQPKWDKPCYYDKEGVEIEEGDLLEVFHFIHYRYRRKCYMYHVAVWQECNGLWMWRGRDYNAEKAHYNLIAVANKETGILPGYRIIAKPKVTDTFWLIYFYSPIFYSGDIDSDSYHLIYNLPKHFLRPICV